MKKIICDSNQIAQEKGLAAVLAWVDRSPMAPRVAQKIVASLIDKAITARPNTRKLTLDILLLLIEREAAVPVIV